MTHELYLWILENEKVGLVDFQILMKAAQTLMWMEFTKIPTIYNSLKHSQGVGTQIYSLISIKSRISSMRILPKTSDEKFSVKYCNEPVLERDYNNSEGRL